MARRSTRRFVALGFVLVAGIAVTPPVDAGPSGFRCPDTGRLISKGDSLYEVRRKCREPDDSHQRMEYRTIRQRVGRWYNGVMIEHAEERVVEVVVDEWVYDFGRHRFVEHLVFESGRLISVVEGERGID